MTSQKGKTNPAESIESAAAAMSRAKALLTTASVEDCSYCETELAVAMESLQNLRQSLEALAVPAGSEMREATEQIRRDVVEFTGLLHQAKEFHAGWSALSESGASGYDAAGVPAPVERDPSRIALKG